MADEKKKEIERESTDSGIVSSVKDEILEQHYREHPEGDPAVRRIRPDRGEIPIEEVHDDGTMTVREKRSETQKDSKEESEEKKRAG